MGALVEATLVAHDFPGIEGGATPGRGLCGVTVETAAAEILGLLAGGVVGELDGHGCAGGGGEKGGVVVGLEGEGGKAELGGDDEGGVLELDRLGVAAVGEGVAVDGVGVVVLVLGEVVADVGEGGAAGDGMEMVVVVVLLLVVVPFGVVGAVVDVDVWGVGVGGVVVVELLEEGVWLAGVGEPGGVSVDHEVGFLEDVGDRSDREGVLCVGVEEVGLVRGRGARGGGSVREGGRGRVGVELHRERRSNWLAIARPSRVL